MENTEDTLPGTEDQSQDKVTDQERDVTDSEEEDPIEAAVKARFEAEAERIRQEVREETRRDYEERQLQEQQVRQQEAEMNRMLSSFGSTVREIRDNLKKREFWDDDGNRRTLTDQEIEDLVIRPMSRYNLVGEQAVTAKFGKYLADTALSKLKDSEREEFTKKATGRPLDEWLDHLVEMRARESNWAKQIQRDHEAAVAAAEARGYNKARKSPPPKTGDAGLPAGNRGESNVDLSTLSGLLKARREGLVTDEVFNKRARELGLFGG